MSIRQSPPNGKSNGHAVKKITTSGHPRNGATLERTVFETPRTAEYFDAEELRVQTGQPVRQFFSVILKELVDNGIDAAEQKGVMPEIHIGVMEGWRSVRLYIRDNGNGIAPDTVRRILNYSTRTSDKSAYRSVTRGQQGNAEKTVLGIPTALGGHKPIIIEARGVRHTIQPTVDPAGISHVDYQQEAIPERTGTLIRVELPSSKQDVDPKRWARGFALFNPHAFVKILVRKKNSEHGNSSWERHGHFYKPTVSSDWRKPLPTDLTSPHWYDAAALGKLVFQHINASMSGGRDLTLREFVVQFKGLSGSAKTKAVCDQFPDISRLSDFQADPGKTTRLLNAMQEETKAPSPDVLGCIGKEHFRALFHRWYGVKRFWYHKARGFVDGGLSIPGSLPFIVEVALAETSRPGHVFHHGINFSPTFQDPVGDKWFRYFDSGSDSYISGSGVKSFLGSAHVGAIHSACAIHLICPSLQFVDRGKTRLDVSGNLAGAISTALWTVSKTVYGEQERRKKNAAREEKRERQEEELAAKPAKPMALTEAVPLVIMEAVRQAAGNLGIVSAHTLYYVVRKMIQAHTTRILKSEYFEQTLLPAYQQEHGRIKGLYYEPRGTLYEPHTGVAIPLGTREVESYHFPSWLYDKILFVEKKGLWPVFQAAKLAEKYDMAIVAGEGYATEACRVLFANAERGKEYQLFVVHDADPHGYNIARTLRDETWRMPGHRVEIIDIGLKLQEALDLGLQPEEFTRQKALPQELELTQLEREYFEGRKTGKKSWLCKRVELNGFTNPDLIAYTERGLEANGVRGKVIPDEEAMPALAEGIYREVMRGHVQDTLDEILNMDEIVDEVIDRMESEFPLEDAERWAKEYLANNPTARWRSGILSELRKQVSGKADTIEDLVREEVRRTFE